MKKQPVLIKVFNNAYFIALLLFLAASIGSLCDGVIASKGLGVAELAAVGIVYPYMRAMDCIALLFSSGTQVIIGTKIGQNKFEEVSKVFYTSLAFAAALSVFIAIAVSVFAEPVSKLFGANMETLRPAMDYLVSIALGAPAHLLTLYMIPLFQLDDKKKLIDTATVVMTAVNIALSILFVSCGMGIKGVGYATTISYYAALLILSTHFLPPQQKQHKAILLQGKFAVSSPYLAEIIKEGAPTAFNSLSSAIFNTILNNLVGIVGSIEAMAAFSVYKMTKLIFLSVSAALIDPVRMVQSMLWEEKDHKTLRQIFRYSLLKGMALSTLMTVFIWLFGRDIFSFMVSGAVLDETVSFMRWAGIVFILNSFVCYYSAYFQAINKKSAVYSISIVMNIATLPVFYFLAKAFGSQGVWMGHAAQLVIITVYVLACAYIMGRKNKRLIDKLLVLPTEENQTIYDFHIESDEDAKAAAADFGKICEKSIAQRRKAYYCSLALEEIVFNILNYQKKNNEPDPNIDVHIVVFDNDRMIMRIKDCSKEHNPFIKYEYSLVGDDLENLGIKIVKSFAQDIKYSFIYGVNFITITV